MKKKTPRSPGYLAFVRDHVSALAWPLGMGGTPLPLRRDACAAAEETVAHHVRLGGGGGVGLKPSDYRTVPLTDLEHRELHQLGEGRFWRARGVDPDRLIIALLAAYALDRGAVVDVAWESAAELEVALVAAIARAG